MKKHSDGLIIRVLASGSRFLFWGVIPAGFLLLGALTFTNQGWKQPFVISLDLVFCLFALGLYNPQRFEWALRLFLAIVCLALVVSLAANLLQPQKRHWPDYLAAVHGLYLVAIPAGFYALHGFRKRKTVLPGDSTFRADEPIHPE